MHETEPKPMTGPEPGGKATRPTRGRPVAADRDRDRLLRLGLDVAQVALVIRHPPMRPEVPLKRQAARQDAIQDETALVVGVRLVLEGQLHAAGPSIGQGSRDHLAGTRP